MNKNFKWIATSSFWKDWSNFLGAIVNPYVIVLSLIIWYLKDYEMNVLDAEIRFIANIVSSVTIAVLGGFITHKWLEISGKSTLEARGQGAVRSLDRLNNNIRALRMRNMAYLKRIQEKLNKEVIKTYLEETIEKCFTLEKSAFHAIESWTDILPELKKKITDLGKLEVIDIELIANKIDLSKKEKLINKLKNENKELSGTSNKTNAKRERLEGELESERNTIKKLKEDNEKLKKERKQKAESLLTSDLSSGSFLSNDLNMPASNAAFIFGQQNPYTAEFIGLASPKCKLCKEPYFPSLLGVDLGYCEKHSILGGDSMVVKEDNDE